MDGTTNALSTAAESQATASYPRTSTLTFLPGQSETSVSRPEPGYLSFTSGLRRELVRNRIRGTSEALNGSVLTAMLRGDGLILPYVYVYRGDGEFDLLPRQPPIYAVPGPPGGL